VIPGDSWLVLVVSLVSPSIVMKYSSYQLTRNPTRNDHSSWILGGFLLEWKAPGMTILSQYWLVKIPGRNGRIPRGSYQEQGGECKDLEGGVKPWVETAKRVAEKCSMDVKQGEGDLVPCLTWYLIMYGIPGGFISGLSKPKLDFLYPACYVM